MSNPRNPLLESKYHLGAGLKLRHDQQVASARALGMFGDGYQRQAVAPVLGVAPMQQEQSNQDSPRENGCGCSVQ